MSNISNGVNVREHVPLAPLTTFQIGGEARFFAAAQSMEEVREAIAFASERSLPIFILGGGSNILVSDQGFDGLVLAVHIPGVASEKHSDHVTVTVGSGVVFDAFVAWTIEQNLSGLECLSGIPGTVGGAIVANAGAYGQQVSDVLVTAEVVDLTSKEMRTITMRNEECLFSYHDSIFGHSPARYLVLQATLRLPIHGTPHISYKDNRFDVAALARKNGRQPTLADVRSAILDVREQKGNLIMENRVSYKGAGSFFHLPFVSAEKYTEVLTRAQELDPQKEKQLRPWAWKQADGAYKIAAGFLLEYTEFKKGYIRGNVGVSPKHTLAIINLEGACAQEVAALAHDMQNAVHTLFGIRLEREVEYVGFS